ncbi:MAG: MopE-related protein, partial [Archangium sp.]
MFRLLCCSLMVAALVGCGPSMLSCETDLDCGDTGYCVSSVCVARNSKPDAGADAGVDAGVVEPMRDAGTIVDAGTVADAGFDAGVEPECELHDTRNCCGGRGEQTCVQVDGGLAWDECDATKTAESCNGVDDDCDGTIDDELNWVAPDGGVVSSLECSIGVGACASNGVFVCNSSGLPVCGAATIQPTSEVCDSIDNDCDGTTDEGTTVTCLADADNDRYASASAVELQLCPDSNRNDWGNCPSGFVAPTASVAVDCDDTSATAFRNVSVRTDGDGDAYCVGAAFSTCVGATIPSGLRLPTSCESTDDCNDAAPTVFRYADTRPDNDGDGYCKGEAATTCIGAAAPSGRKIATECVATDDCDDNSSEVFRFEMTRKDSDNDTYCTDAAVNSCIGNGAPAGRRIQANCGVTDDCDDNLSSAYRWASVKKDVDGDQYCAGNATNLCIGATPPATWRIASTCLVGDDCGDTNPL